MGKEYNQNAGADGGNYWRDEYDAPRAVPQQPADNVQKPPAFENRQGVIADMEVPKGIEPARVVQRRRRRAQDTSTGHLPLQ